MHYMILVLLLLGPSACQKAVEPPDDYVEAEFVREPDLPDPYTRSGRDRQSAPPQPSTPSGPLRQPVSAPTPSSVQPSTQAPASPAPPPPPAEERPPQTPPKPKMTTATVIETGNNRARVKPQLDAYINGEHCYLFEAGNIYHIYAAKGRVTTLILEPGEEISESGFYAADLKNWQYEPNGRMGYGPDERPVVVIMPYHSGIVTNLSIATNRRLYLLELRAFKTTYMPAVSWHYPERDNEKRLAQLQEQQSHRRLMQAPRINPEDIRTPYLIEAVKAKKGLPEWMPRVAMHDGQKTYITFGPEVMSTPALFVNGSKGLGVVQFRVRGNRDGGMTYIVDHILHKAELRLIHGEQENEPGTRVVIEVAPRT